MYVFLGRGGGWFEADLKEGEVVVGRSVDPLLTSPSCFLRPHPPLVLPSQSLPQEEFIQRSKVSQSSEIQRKTLARSLAGCSQGSNFLPMLYFPSSLWPKIKYTVSDNIFCSLDGK